MTLTNPADLLSDVTEEEYREVLARSRTRPSDQKDGDLITCSSAEVDYVEPALLPNSPHPTSTLQLLQPSQTSSAIVGQIYRMGDAIDTDAVCVSLPTRVFTRRLKFCDFQIIPGQACVSCTTDEELGAHCFELFDPAFRSCVRSGLNVVVAGKAFGCGSSREEAVRALKGKWPTMHEAVIGK